MNISDRLRQIRSIIGLSQQDASIKYGLTLSSYKKYEAGSVEPGSAALTLIANAGINPYWLLTGEGDMLLGAENSAVKTIATPLAQPGPMDDFVLVPLYNVEASAGHGSDVDYEEQISQIAFRKDWLRAKGLYVKDLSTIKVKGDSMEPTLADGDIVLVDNRIQSIIDDAIYIIQTDNHLIVKRLQQALDGSLIIISDNPRYKAYQLDPAQASGLKIAGRVCWCGHDM